MVKILMRIKRMLKKELAGFESGLDENKQTGRVIGYIVSSDFINLSQKRRQQKLDKLLKAELSKEEMRRVGPIVTMTPEEASIDELAD